MTSSNSPTEMRRGIEETMRAHWVLFLAQGLIMMTSGLAITMAALAGRSPVKGAASAMR